MKDGRSGVDQKKLEGVMSIDRQHYTRNEKAGVQKPSGIDAGVCNYFKLGKPDHESVTAFRQRRGSRMALH